MLLFGTSTTPSKGNRPNRDLATPNTLVVRWQSSCALVCGPCRTPQTATPQEATERFAIAAQSSFPLPWLVAKKECLPRSFGGEDERDRTSSACRYSYAGGGKVAARTLLAEVRSAGNEETWGPTLVVSFPPENHAVVSVALTAAITVAITALLVNATDAE